MPNPTDVPIIDLMLEIPNPDRPTSAKFLLPLLRDEQSREQFSVATQYMFKDIPQIGGKSDYVAYTLQEMDKVGIERALITVSEEDETSKLAVRNHPDRFIPSGTVDPNQGIEALRRMVREYEEFGIKAVTTFPCGNIPQVPINDKRYYPVYAKCVEIDIPIFCCAGVPGPRIPMDAQKVELVDEVCWFFPDLVFIFRHGCEPWTELAVKLMLKWPNLYYSTSAFAPKHYPKAIVDYANTRGADRVLYAGYFPMGLSLERIFRELPDVPFRDHVWPKFLRENALRLFDLDG